MGTGPPVSVTFSLNNVTSSLPTSLCPLFSFPPSLLAELVMFPGDDSWQDTHQAGSFGHFLERAGVLSCSGDRHVSGLEEALEHRQ